MKTMIEKQFVTYKIALKLKELGFNEECLAFSYIDKQIRWYYEEWDKLSTSNFGFIRNSIIDEYGRFEEDEFGNIEEIVAIPLYSQVIDWFREKHNIHIEIELTDNTMQFYYQYCIVDSKNREHHDEDMIDQATRIYNYNEKFNTFYEAREQAILKAIELCQK